MSSYTRWILINILLPLSPFGLRLFVIYIGDNQKLTFSTIAEIPEILFYSIFTCVVILNINMNHKKNGFEQFIRIFILIILVLDFITLGMVYNNNYGINTLIYSVVASIIPAIIAIVYRFVYKKISSGDL